MAIVRVKKMEILTWGEDAEDVLGLLASSRAFHIVNVSTGESPDTDIKKQLSEIHEFLQVKRDLEDTLTRLGQGKLLSKSMFLPRKEYSESDAERFWNTQGKQLMEEAKKMLSEARGLRDNISELKRQIDLVSPWDFVPVPLSELNTKHLQTFFLIIPVRYAKGFMDTLKSLTADGWFWGVKKGKNLYVVAVFDREVPAEIEDWLEFAITLPYSDKKPADLLQALSEELRQLEDKLQGLYSELVRFFTDLREKFLLVFDYLEVKQRKLEAILEKIVLGKRFAAISGWVYADKVEEVKRAIEDKKAAVVSVSEPGEDEKVPVQIKNPWYLRPFEFVTRLYGVPHYRFIDTTPLIAPAFFIFFGLALSDAGYGLLLIIAALYFLFRYPKAEEGTKTTLLFVFYMGLAATIVGFITWTWFGESPFVENGLIFGKIPYFNTTADINVTLGVVLILGIVMQFYAMWIKGWWALKHGDWQTAVFDVLVWQILLLSLVVMVLPTVGLNLPENYIHVAKIVAAVAAILLILTQGRHLKNPVMRIAFGLISLYGIAGGYGVASFLADTLSYSRLLALNLSTGIVAHVLNVMLVPMVKFVIGLVLLLAAHVLNLALGILGSFVHSARLIFLEMYGRFFEGVGEEFKPFTLDGKFYKFVKEVDAE